MTAPSACSARIRSSSTATSPARSATCRSASRSTAISASTRTSRSSRRFTASATSTARRDRLLEMTQLTKFRGRLADQLSGGMKQKLALACTLVHEPQVIVLDEPTTGVDPVSRREFWKLLSQFLAQGITILMSTPYLDEAERCSRIALLHEGKVLALDQPGRLARRPDRHPVRSRRAVAARGARQARGRSATSRARRCSAIACTSGSIVPIRQAAEAILTSAVQAAGLAASSIRPIVPSLEDVFIARLADETAQPGPQKSRNSALQSYARHLVSLSDRCLPRMRKRSRRFACRWPTRSRAGSRTAIGSPRRARGKKAPGPRPTAPTLPTSRRSTPAPATRGPITSSNFGFPRPDGAIVIVFPDIPDNFTSRLSFQWPIYTSGRIDALERAAIAEAQAAGADIETDPRRSASGDRARLLGGGDRAGGRTRARGIHRARRSAGDRREESLRRRLDSAERSVDASKRSARASAPS